MKIHSRNGFCHENWQNEIRIGINNLVSLFPYKSCLAHTRSSATIRFTRGKNKHAFPSLVSVKQGDNIAPIMFLFVMQAAMETL